MDWLQTLTTLTQAHGVSGNEKTAAEAALPLFSQYCDAYIDRNLSLVATLRNSPAPDAPVLVLDAHLDEIGMIVTGIDDDGFVSCSPIGGMLGRHLLSSEVIIHGREDVYGVIGATPPHLQSAGDSKSAAPDKCHIDTGFTRAQLAEKIALGDTITFVGPTERLDNDRILSKALDDRSCCAILLRAAELLTQTPPACKVVFTLTSGEETTARGSSTTAFALQPDTAVAFDVTFAKEPESPSHILDAIGSGPAIGISPILDRALFTQLKALAEQNHIPYTVEVMPGRTSTNADHFALSRAGVRTGVVSLPLRYMHTPSELCDEHDLEACAQLAAALAHEM